MEFPGVVSVTAITVVCYCVAQFIKITAIDNKWIPVICFVVGAGLGVIGMHIMPDFPAEDAITSIAVGAVSGGAATGVNQAYKMTAFEERE